MDKILDEVTVTLFSNVLNKKIQEIKIKVRKFEKEKKRKERVGRFQGIYRGSMVDWLRRIECSRDANIAPVVDTVPRLKFGPVCLAAPVDPGILNITG